jgi:hypothetical protein
VATGQVKIDLQASPPSTLNMEIIDAITFEPIPVDQHITVPSGETTYHFNITTLVSLLASNPVAFVNPFTQQPFDEAVTRRVREHSQVTIRFEVLSLTEPRHPREFQVPGYTSLGEVILGLLQQSVPKLTQLSDLFAVDIISQKDRHSVYKQDLSMAIGTLPEYQRLRAVSVSMNPRAHTLPREMYPRWAAFARGTNRPELLAKIPRIYLEPPPIHPDPSDQDYVTLQEVIEAFPALDQLIIQVMQICAPLRITAAQAQELEDTIETRFPQNKQNWVVEHLIYSRVVDKFNLRPHSGIQGYYYQDEYKPPSFGLMVRFDQILTAIRQRQS